MGTQVSAHMVYPVPLLGHKLPQIQQFTIPLLYKLTALETKNPVTSEAGFSAQKVCVGVSSHLEALREIHTETYPYFQQNSGF